MRLAVRTPFAGRQLLDFLALRVVAGIEAAGGRLVRADPRLPYGAGPVRLELDDAPGPAQTAFVTAAPAGRPPRHRGGGRAGPPSARRRLRPAGGRRRSSPATRPSDRWSRDAGLRVPGHVDGHEVAVRAVLGQQITVAGARTVRHARGGVRPAGRDRSRGSPISSRCRDPGRARPRGAPMPRSRGRALVGCPRPSPPARSRWTAAPTAPTYARAPGPARHRPVDRRLRGAASSRRPRRVPADRPRGASGPGRARSRPGDALPDSQPGVPGAPTGSCTYGPRSCRRPAAPPPPQHHKELTCGPSWTHPWVRCGSLPATARSPPIDFTPSRVAAGGGRARGDAGRRRTRCSSRPPAATGVLRAGPQGVRPSARAPGHRVPAAGVGRAPESATARPRRTARWPAASARPATGHERWGWPTAATRSRS